MRAHRRSQDGSSGRDNRGEVVRSEYPGTWGKRPAR
jgi:hypothetical protein